MNRRSNWVSLIRAEGGLLALVALASTAWLLIALAKTGSFAFWPAALPLLVLVVLLALWSLWRSDRVSQFAVLLLFLLAALLYTPPAQHLALSGDSAIYPNEAAWLARTHSLSAAYEPFAPLSPAVRDLFYIASDEQFPWNQVVQSYEGLLYGGYYVSDEGIPLIRNSRMPQVVVWLALLIKLAGLQAAFWFSPAAAALAMVLLFALARSLFGPWIGIWCALLITICYPQIYFARQPLAEIAGQVWTLAGFWCALRWARERRPVLAALAILFWSTAWSSRVDAVLLAGPALLVALVAAQRRDGRSLRALGLALPIVLLLGWLGNNRAYTGATLELFSSFLDLLIPVFVTLLVLIPTLVGLVWWLAPSVPALWQRAGPALSLLLFLLVAFGVGWSTIPNPLRNADQTRNFQEIIWFSSVYLSPLLYWLAAGGVGLMLWRGLDGPRFVVLGSLLGLGAAYFYTYTSAPVYPVSLRRLIGEVLPLMALSAGYALALLPHSRRTHIVQTALAVVALGWIGWLALPIVRQHEAADDVRFVHDLHTQIGHELGDRVTLIFEPQDADSWLGWLAAPLYSVYADHALLLESDTPDPKLFAKAVAELEAAGRTPYLVTQHSPPPATLIPLGVRAKLTIDLLWASSLIGQTRDPYPPPYWEFAHPLYFHLLRAEP